MGYKLKKLVTRFVLVNLVFVLISSALYLSILMEVSHYDYTRNNSAITFSTNSLNLNPFTVGKVELNQKIDIPNNQLNISQIEILRDSELYFSGTTNLDSDDVPEIILTVDHGPNSQYIGFSIVVLDGLSFLPIRELTSGIDRAMEFTNSFLYVNFSNSINKDLILMFRKDNACNILLLETDNFDKFNFEINCDTFNFVIPNLFTGKSDFIQIDNHGSYFLYDLEASFQSKTKVHSFGSIYPANFQKPASFITRGNFTNDANTDWLIVNSNTSLEVSEIYIIDGQDNSFVSNYTVNSMISWIETLNLDDEGTDEIIFVNDDLSYLQTMNASLDLLEYAEFRHITSQSSYNLIEDVDGDNVVEILIMNSLSTLIISGRTGHVIVATSINNAMKSSVPSFVNIEIGQLSDSFYFVRHFSSEGITIYSLNQNEGMSSNFKTNWLESLTQENRNFDEYTISITRRQIDLSNDQDKDGLTSFEEFLLGSSDSDSDTDNDGLSDFTELIHRTNPTNYDTDYDLMSDKWEIDNNLNPLLSNANEDPDKDGLTNIIEQNEGLDPLNSDTDGDELPDGWELNNGLNPLIQNYIDSDYDGLDDQLEYSLGTLPNNNDSDGDGMLDKWEYDFGLDPLDSLDANYDLDDDGLSNIDEYLAETFPDNSDTDGDGLPDGWEVKYGLDPLKSEEDWDVDGDFLSNKLELELGTNPNGRFDAFFAYFIILAFATSPFIGISYYRKLNRVAKTVGFDSYRIKRRIYKLGFKTFDEYIDAKNNGFLSAGARNLAFAYGFRETNSLKNHWISYIEYLQNKYNEGPSDKFNFTKLVSRVNKTRFQKELTEMSDELVYIFVEVDKDLKQISQIIFEIKNLENLYTDSKLDPFVDLTHSLLQEYSTQLESYTSTLRTGESNIKTSMEQRKEWFEPWNSLLALIRVTNDREGVTLEEISGIIKATEDHTEELILLLLEENKFIGVYDANSKIYTKGTDVEDYISFVMRKFVMTEENDNNDSSD